jgi:hypothetical protein
MQYWMALLTAAPSRVDIPTRDAGILLEVAWHHPSNATELIGSSIRLLQNLNLERLSAPLLLAVLSRLSWVLNLSTLSFAVLVSSRKLRPVLKLADPAIAARFGSKLKWTAPPGTPLQRPDGADEPLDDAGRET